MTTLPKMTEAVEAPSWTVRLEEAIDLDQIHELHRIAFRGLREAELVDAIRSSASFVPTLSLVAVTDDGSVLGHVLISRILLEADNDTDAHGESVSVLALAPIAVLPQHHGRGIGTALMREALAMADELEEPMIVVVGAPSFYGRFGFTPAIDHGLHGPYDDAGEAFQVRPRPGSGIRPGRLVYPPAFAAV